MASSILIIEDDALLADNIRLYLERNHWEAHVVHSAEEGLARLADLHPDIVLTDHMLPGKTGLELIREALALDPQVKIVVMTGEGSIQIAVEAMKAGACDFMTKPISLAELKLVIEKVVGQAKIENTLSVYQRRQSQGMSLANMIGESPPMQAVKARARQVLEAERHILDGELPAILITGETGTGKGLLARAMHFESVRRDRPFVEINCASLPPNLLEAELFGYERGAFTDARERKIGLVEGAEGGTLFLDEIGELDLSLQTKLLKLLEEKTLRRIGSVRERAVNIRIISATNQDLERLVQERRFRSDLYFRLRVITLAMPPLRRTRDDILRIAEHYLQGHARRYGKPGLHFSPEAKEALLRYSWPGNVRELRNMLEQTVLLAQGELVTPGQLAVCPGLANEERPREGEYEPGCEDAPPAFTKLPDMERDLVRRTLVRTDWNVSKSAKLLGLSRDMMRSRIEKYGLHRREE